MSFLLSDFFQSRCFFFFFLYSNQEGFDAVIKDMGLMGILWDVNLSKSASQKLFETKAFLCSLRLL